MPDLSLPQREREKCGNCRHWLRIESKPDLGYCDGPVEASAHHQACHADWTCAEFKPFEILSGKP